MAHFYGKLAGARGEATRLGSKASGLAITAASWEGAVCVTLTYDEGQQCDVARVELIPWRGVGTSRVLYVGQVDGRAE